MVELTPSDGIGEGEKISTSLSIGNTLPTFESIEITPSQGIDSGTTLSCEATASDLDDDSMTYTYTWRILRDGFFTEFEEAGDTFELNPSLVQPTDKVYCFSEVFEAEQNGETLIDSSYVTVENQTPEVTSVLISPSTGVRSGDSLFCYGQAQDSDLSELTLEYQWQQNANFIGLGQEIILDSDNAAKGDIISCQLTATDPHEGEAQLSFDVTVSNTAPTMTEIGINPTQPTSQEDIECTGIATDADSSDFSLLSYTYNWFSDGVIQSETSSILVAPFSVGSEIQCTVTVSDGEDEGDSLTTSVIIANTVPEVTSFNFDIDPIYTNDLLTTTVVSEDIDGDTITLNYDWYVDGILVKTGLGNTLDGIQDFDKNQQVWTIVTPNDGTEDGNSYTSDILTVQNSPPDTPILSIEPAVPLPEMDPLVCIVGPEMIDDDGDSLSYLFEWTKNGSPYTGDTEDTTYVGDTIPADEISDQEFWDCQVTIIDSTGDSVSAVSPVTSVDCNAVYGLAEGCPAASCKELITSDPNLFEEDGVYWLIDTTDPTAESFEAWCDMSHDGGGWTLILKADDASDALAYHAVQWESYLLLNESDVMPNDDPYGSDAKYESFNVTKGSALRLEFTDPEYNIMWDDRHDMDMGETIRGDYHETSTCGGTCYVGHCQCYSSATNATECASEGPSAIWTDGLCTGTALELFTGPQVLILGVLFEEYNYAHPSQNLLEMPDYTELMIIGMEQEFYGVNGISTGLTTYGSLRFGVGSSSTYYQGHPWTPQYGIGATSQSARWDLFINENTSYPTGTYGLGYQPTTTSSNLWVR